MTGWERFLAVACLTLLAAPDVPAQRRRPAVDPQSAEGWLIRQIDTTPETEPKLARLLDFLQQHPTSGSAPWALELVQDLSMTTKRHARAIEAGARLLALEPDNLEAAHKNLKSAEELKDPALVKSAAETVRKIAKRTLAAQGPASALARQLIPYTDYLAYVEILASTDPRQRLELLDRYQAEIPQSAYTAQVRDMYFSTYQQMGDAANALRSAQGMIDRETTNEDALLFAAEAYFASPREGDRAVSVATRLVDVLAVKPKPEGIDDAEWVRKRSQLGGRAYWMIGKIGMDQGRFAQADRALRSALPHLRGNDALTAAALFHLGWANYKLGNHADAIKFNQQCLAYKSSFREQAAKNLAAIQAEKSVKP